MNKAEERNGNKKDKVKRRFIKKGDRLCPECLCDNQRLVVKQTDRVPTKWHGLLVYWKCHYCKNSFVSSGESGSLELVS